MYAVNMFYYHWLIKKLLWSMKEQTIAGGKSGQRCKERVGVESRRHHVAVERKRCQNLTSKP